MAAPTQQLVTTATQLIDPDGVPGTRFTGPIMSGPKGQLSGVAILSKRIKFTFANGSFSIPVVLPASSILIQAITQVQQVFNGLTPTYKLELTQGGSVITGPVDLTTGPTQLITNLTTILTSNWTFYMTVALGAGCTQGKATAIVTYSVPAKAGS